MSLAPGTPAGTDFDGKMVPGTAAESYRLDISPDGILITAGHPAGVFRARQTVRQLLESGLSEIPCGIVEDAPRFPWRGMLLDCGRHFMPLETIKHTLDQLALHKFNVLHWHLTEDQGWRLEVPGYPRLTDVSAWRTEADGTVYGGFYTTEQVREIVAYAAERFITVVPEIELPGHSVAALAAYPELSCTGGPFTVQAQWGVHEDVYCAGNEQTFAFLEDVFRHVMEVFPSTYIHIGGDECPKERWMACPKCQERIRQEQLADEHELQSWFIRRMERFLGEHGRRLIGWDEILEGGLAPAATVQSWRGMQGAIAAARQDHDTIVSPTSHCYFDYDVAVTDLRQVYTFDPVPAELEAGEIDHILGGEMNLWTEYIPPERLDRMVFPRMTAMAECLWTADPERDFREFLARVTPHMAWLRALGVRPGPAARPLKPSGKSDGPNGTFLLEFITDPELVEALGQQSVAVRYRRLPEGLAFAPLVRPEEQGLPPLTPADEPLAGPILVTPGRQGDQLVAAQLFLDDNPYGAPAVARFSGHLAVGHRPQLAHPASSRYRGGGPDGLTDGLRGDRTYRQGAWSGFEAADLDAVIDLGEMTDLSRLELGCFQKAPSWIFLPEKVEWFVSDNGTDWRQAATVGHDISPRLQDRIGHEFVADVPGTRARFVRVVAHSLLTCPDWHPGAGGPCWLFADEIVIR